jgi:prepilin peptidase CpaA
VWALPAGDAVPAVKWGVALGVAMLAAACDLRWRRIPNMLTLPALLAGLTWSVWRGGTLGSLNAAGGAVLLAAPYLLLFVFAGGGAGDVKLTAALGAWLGVADGLIAIVAIAVCGALLGLAYAWAGGHLARLFSNLTRIVAVGVLAIAGRQGRRFSACLPERETLQTMPYGIAILAGVCLAAGVVRLWHGH